MTTIVVLVLLCVGIWFWLQRRGARNASEAMTAHGHAAAPPSASENRGAPEEPVQEEAPPPEAAPVDDAAAAKSEKWRDWLALTTTIVALTSAVMTLEVSRYTTLAVLNQGKETNAWSYYQAKSVKEHTYQISKAALELQHAATPGMPADAAEKFQKTIKSYDDEIKRYKDEKDEIMEQAVSLGKKKDKYHKLSAGFSNSLVFLQVSIVLSSIGTMMRKKYLWYVSLATLSGWLYFLINSF